MPRFLSLSVIASLLFFAVPAHAQDQLRWETDLNVAQKQAAQTNRLLLIHFWGTWCPPCMEMEKAVFSKPGLGTAISPYYVPVKIQVEEGMNQELAKQFQVDGYPCDIVMTAQGEIVSKTKGFKPADKYVAMLNQAAQQALAQARSNGHGPVAGAAPQQPGAPVAAAAPADASRYGAPARTTQPNADPRYAQYAPPVTAQAAPPAAAAAPKTDDRYAAYYQSRGMAAPAAPAAAAPVAAVAPITPNPYTAPSAAPVAPVAAVPPAATTPPFVAPAVAAPVAATPPAAVPAVPPAAAPAAPPATVAASAAPAAPAAAPKQPIESLIPAGSPPLALDGYCPVTVTEKMVWTKGSHLYGAIHCGRTYLFSSTENQQKFLANPDRFSPIISGNDPVVALEKNEIVSGRRQFGLVYENRMILFSSKDSYDKFCKESKRYTTELQQALQSSNAIRR
ncbi:MAG: thioredoxin family protein [Planctomycetia bacterium]|nr:thioredoxin family protein [Planctomycetia bacterium]